MHAWVDGSLLPDPHARAVRVTDHGLTVGDGVFETLKVVDGRPFALGPHLDRLARSATGLGLDGAHGERSRGRGADDHRRR
jgi:branched-chain amino acid aminotransferase